MSRIAVIRDQLSDHAALAGRVAAEMAEEISDLAALTERVLRAGNKIMFCGNGGSAADAQHLAAEYVVRFRRDRAALAAIALTTDSSILTAGGNDYGFKSVFERQVMAIGAEGDLLVLHSTSGESENLLLAADAARGPGRSRGGTVGQGGGRLKNHVDSALVVPTDSTARAQEVHLTIGHIVCGLVEDGLAEGWVAEPMTGRRPEAPPAVRWITRTLEEAGHESWAVGGAVRDALMGRASGDWDLTTHARPKDIRRIFKRTVPIGVEHGTVGVLARDGTMYEVTTFRRDVETDGRHAVVSFADKVEDDLSRRDFTINAIAWHPLREILLDPFDGEGDLERGVLRTVGHASVRFREDHLRILRAFRFAGRFGMSVAPPTWRALSALVGELPSLSAERIRDELLKVLESDPVPSHALSLYGESGALGVLYPEWEVLRSGAARDLKTPGAAPVVPTDPGADTGPLVAEPWRVALATADALPTGRPFLRLAALLRGLAPASATALLMRLRLSNVQLDETARRAAAAPLPDPDATDVEYRRWLSREGAARLAGLARIDLANARGKAALGAPPVLRGGCLSVASSTGRARCLSPAGGVGP